MEIIDPVPMEKWGKDHWSTLAYIETRIVDYKGKLEPLHMRPDGNSYPTILKGNNQNEIDEIQARATAGEPVVVPDPIDRTELKGHNDWDCAADMFALGLIDLEGEVPDKLINGRVIHRLVHQDKIRIALTEEGQKVAGALRAHKGNGENFHSFVYMSDYPRYDKLNVPLGKGVGPGWLPLVEGLITELDELYPGWSCEQIKEKYGGLRFYAEPPEGVSFQTFQGTIDDYENQSYKTCEICGEPGDPEPGPNEKDSPFRWINTLCDKHKGERVYDHTS